MAGQSPIVSVIMANHNGGKFIEAAISTVLTQTIGNIELIIADDASDDDSIERVSAIATHEPRLKLLRSIENIGPARARNLCLDAAKGEWVAVVDSDDLIHPQRLARLVSLADADSADIVADDLLIFSDGVETAPAPCLRGRSGRSPFWIDAASYVSGNALFGGPQALGYLKPVIRRALIERLNIRYDPKLWIAEDYDFILRLLLGGGRFRVYPLLTYFYRKHRHSISHRLSRQKLEPMLAAHARMRQMVSGRNGRLDLAMAERETSLVQALAFEDLVAALKRRAWREAVRQTLRHPLAALMLRQPLLDRMRRMLPARSRQRSNRRQICVVSRQRVVGATNGSSTYLLGICTALRDRGCDVHLIWPSPAMFGRRPWLSLRPEMAVFSTINARHAVRLGRHLIAFDPRIWLRALLAISARALIRTGFPAYQLDTPAPYAVSQEWTRRDLLFVAHQGRGRADVMIADYAFLTEGIPYALNPAASTAVIMHDLFSSRRPQFNQVGAIDSVVSIDLATEISLLQLATVIVAIQHAEAATVQDCLPNHCVVIAPIAVVPVRQPQPGHGQVVLFVGSNTAPNVLGLRWFLDSVWPSVRAQAPDARLQVAGSVSAAMPFTPEGVELLGLVPNLTENYRNAAVVISPLLVGSGLKIKLIEAFGHGKAVVATTVTLQGVEDVATHAVMVADDPNDFASAILSLLTNPALRRSHAAAALEVARRHFSPAACYGELLNALAPTSDTSVRVTAPLIGRGSAFSEE